MSSKTNLQSYFTISILTQYTNNPSKSKSQPSPQAPNLFPQVRKPNQSFLIKPKMINSTSTISNLPTLLKDEERIQERKDVRAEIFISTKNYLEQGILFLTTSRLIFLSPDGKDLQSFECELFQIKDLSYQKQGDFRTFEGIILGSGSNNFCRFKFGLAQTGFRSLVSVLFSIKHQMLDS